MLVPVLLAVLAVLVPVLVVLAVLVREHCFLVHIRYTIRTELCICILQHSM